VNIWNFQAPRFYNLISILTCIYTHLCFMYVFCALWWSIADGPESASGCQNSASFDTTVPEGNEWHLYPTQAVGLFWVPGHAGVRGNEITDKLARDGSVQRFVGPEPFLGFSRQNIRIKMKRWMEKQHLVLWRGPCSKQRQARELISGPDLATGAWLLSFNRTQSRVVIGLLTGHNTLRRHLYIMGLSNNGTE
jgi:hypothetical protein